MAVEDRGEPEEQTAGELLRDAEQAFGEIFSVRAPRDILVGLWSGVQCILSGAFLGMACIVAQPIEGMRDSGVPGCFKGVALGVFTGLFFSITGLCTGMFQAVRGALATPRALCMVSKGWRWDRSAGQWAEPTAYSLPLEAACVLPSGEEEEDDDGGGRRRAVDTFYYDELGLAPSATQRDIRQAYFHQSKRWHPDKTSEPRAKERFQAISEAYQVLSDPERRRTYDQQGRQGAGEGFVDARIFFSVLLGADALEPYIGRLRLAETFGNALFGGAGDADETGAEARGLQQHVRDAERAERRQVRRQVRLAVALAERLDARGDAADGGFRERALEEAQGLLRKDPSVERFLAEIGWVYQNRADSYLARFESLFGAFGLHLFRLRLRRRGREASQQARTAKLAVRSYLKLRRIVREADETAMSGEAAQGEEEELPSAISSALPTFMETFWSLTAHDITSTLDKVVERVLTDASVSSAARLHRAGGLRELGGAFVAAAEATRAEASAAAPEAVVATAAASAGCEDERKRKRFEEAFIASMGAGVRPEQ